MGTTKVTKLEAVLDLVTGLACIGKFVTDVILIKRQSK